MAAWRGDADIMMATACAFVSPAACRSCLEQLAAQPGRAAGLAAHVMEEAEEPITPALMDFAGKIDYADPE